MVQDFLSGTSCDKEFHWYVSLYQIYFKKYYKQKDIKTMCSVIQFVNNFLKRILKLTLYQVLWICMLFLFFFIYWVWTFKANEEYENEIEYSGNPAIVWWTSGFPGTSGTVYCKDIKCDVYSESRIEQIDNVDAYLFYASNIDFKNLPLPRKPQNIWGLYHEESPRNVEELMHEEALHLFNYSATFSRYSDVPFPLQYLESLDDVTSTKYFVTTEEKNSLLKNISPILYLQSDCETATERDDYVKELMKYIKVDSYGACLNNKEMPKKFTDDYLNNLNDNDFLHFIARYKFVLAIENGVCDDYITEKLWRPIKVGSVPIYFGSPTIQDWLPNKKSAILLEDHPTPKIMSEYLHKLMADDELYNQYLSHKTESMISNERLVEEFYLRKSQKDDLAVVNAFECLICERVHELRERKLPARIINNHHYNCPKPISALTLQVNPSNHWVFSWQRAKERAINIYKKVQNG